MAVSTQDASAGRLAWHSGAAAERQVAQHYERLGYAIARRRWRGQGGEIDLIARKLGEVVFIEVKKGRSLAEAAGRLRQAQMRRILRSAEDFLSREPQGALTPARFDVALVDGSGQIEILENAFGLT